jgi:hypothetical protein
MVSYKSVINQENICLGFLVCCYTTKFEKKNWCSLPSTSFILHNYVGFCLLHKIQHNAVFSFWQNFAKNQPKEISGNILFNVIFLNVKILKP